SSTSAPSPRDTKNTPPTTSHSSSSLPSEYGCDLMSLCLSHDGLLYRKNAKVGSLLRTCAQDRYCRYGVSRTRCIAITNPVEKQEDTGANTLGRARSRAQTEARTDLGGAGRTGRIQQELHVGDREQGRRAPFG